MIFSLLLMTGCGGGEGKKPSEDAGKIKLGMITRLNASEENFGEFMKKVEETLDVKIYRLERRGLLQCRKVRHQNVNDRRADYCRDH